MPDAQDPCWLRGTDWAAATWTDIEARARRGRLAVIPSGAIEVYGPHLPVGSDSIVAEAIARRVADGLDAPCAPLVAVGYSADLMSFPGTLSVEPAAFVGYLEGICRGLIRWGFTDLLFVNTHLGNVALIDQVAVRLIDEDPWVRCLAIDWWRYAVGYGDELWRDRAWAVGHAGELGTSVLQAVAGELVCEDRIADYVPEAQSAPRGVIRYTSFRDDTPVGAIGVASAATRSKGEQVVTRAVEGIVAEARAYFVAR